MGRENTATEEFLTGGVFAAALTPMDEKLNLDYQAFVTHCSRLLASGCHGLGVFGTTGEANSLSLDERITALETLVDDGIPADKLLPGTGSCAISDAIRMSRISVEIGAPGVLVLPPFYYKGVSDDGLFRFFAELIEGVGDDRLKVYLYHIPQMTSIGFSLSLIQRLLEAYPGSVVGTKDSAGDLERIRTLCREFPDFDVFAGTERYLLDTLREGGAGCISATVNVTSQLARQVFDLHEAGEDKEAQAMQQSLTEVRAAIEAFPPIPALKGLMGRLTGEEVWQYIRPPLVELDDEQAQELVSDLVEREFRKEELL
ncbi:MAG: dihydrodipicolinate synthase family protein [Rubrobacteraceae bacterium]